MENAEIADYPHRWCRVVHRARWWVLLPAVALVLVAAVASGDVFRLAALVIGASCGATYSWWAARRARRGGDPEEAPERREHHLHAVLYAKVGWARAAVATDVLATTVYVAAFVLASATLWTESTSEHSIASFVAVAIGLGFGTALFWWEDWVHDRAVGFHVVDSDGTVLTTR